MADMEVAIIGGGNFGTAIANIVAGNGFVTHLWMRDEAQVADCLSHRVTCRGTAWRTRSCPPTIWPRHWTPAP